MPTTSKPRDRSATIPTTVLTSHAAERVTADARITAVARSRRFHWFDPDDATETVIVAVQLAMISGTADRSNQNIAGMSVQFTMSADGFLLAQTVRSENDGAGSCNSSNRTVFLLRTPWPESSPVSEEWRIRQDSCNRGVGYKVASGLQLADSSDRGVIPKEPWERVIALLTQAAGIVFINAPKER